MNAPDAGADVGPAADAGMGHDSPDRARLQQLADEQAALRRVATLVAGGAQPSEVFRTVAEEVRRLLDADNAGIARYEPGGRTIVVVGGVGDDSQLRPLGMRVEMRDFLPPAMVWRTGRAARVDEDLWACMSDSVADGLRALGIRSMVASPIIVDGSLWGVMVVLTSRGRFPPDTAERMMDFTELAATAIGNAQAAHELRQLADVQAALRRLALLVARGEPPEAVFAAVTREVLRHFGSGTARMIRFERDGTATLVANEGTTGPHVRVGKSWQGFPATGLTATVWRTGQAARVNDYAALVGVEPYVREGLRSAVGVPIHVDGRLWGMIAVGSGEGPLPPDTEQRTTEFTDLVATAVANAQSRAELITSRARIVAAADDARRRIERDLHDGAQQHLIALALRLRMAAAPDRSPDHNTEFTDVAAELMDLTDELREICRGIHPAILSSEGLRPALRALARRSTVPVELNLRLNGRLPEPIEVGAYYVVSEMLTNAAKHAHAGIVEVDMETTADTLRVRVRDDGVGGADPTRGSGLLGLKDRIEALQGTLSIHSPAGEGTTVSCEVPIPVVTRERPDPEPGV
jgi:signal transduction histidine kinase